jgi:translocation and assembly module TamB
MWPLTRRGQLMATLKALLLALVLLPAPALANDEDVDFLTRTLQGLLSDAGREVRIRGFEGALSSRATIRELTIADQAGVWLSLRGVVLDWDRAALLARRIEVNALSAEVIELRRAPGAPPGAGPDLPSPVARAPFALPELPVAIRVGELAARRVVLGAELLGEAAVVRLDGTAALEGGQGSARLEAVRIDGAEGRLALSGGFDNASRRLVLDFELSEGPGGIAANLLDIPGRPAIRLVAQGDDPIAAFAAELSLATDGRERLSGRATFVDTTPEAGALEGAEFRLDLGGDPRPMLSPNLHPFFGSDTRLVAEGRRAEDGTLVLSELAARTRAFALAGRAELDPGARPRLIDLSVTVGAPDGAPVVLPGTEGAGRIAGAELLVQFDAAAGPDWAVLGRIDALDLPGLGLAQVVLDGRGRIGAGQEDDALPAFDGVLEVAALGIAAADPALQAALGTEVYGLVSLVAPGGGAPIEVTGLALEGQTAALTGQGVLTGLGFEGFLETEVPDLAPFSGLAGRALGGAALASVTGRANPATGAFDLVATLATTDLRIDVPEADNLLAGRAAIEVDIARGVEGTELRRLSVRAGTLDLGAEGRIGAADADLTARLRLSDLGRLGGGYGGALGLALDLRQEGGDWQAGLSGEVADLRIGDRPGAAQVAALFAGRTILTGRAGWREGATRIERLAMSGPQISVEVAGVVTEAAQTVSLRLERLALPALAQRVSGVLAGRADLSGPVGARRLMADLGTLGAVRIGVPEVDALLARGIQARLAGLETAGATVLETLRLSATGLEVAAEGRIEADGAMRLDLAGGLDSLTRVAAGLEGPLRVSGRIARPTGADDLEARLEVTGPSALSLAAVGRIAPDLRLALGIEGAVEAAIANPFVAPATLQGVIRLDGAVNGPPALSSVRLQARVTEGRYVLPGAGVAFGGIAGTAEVAGGVARFRVGGTADRGGTVEAEGTLTLLPSPAVDLSATATRLRVAQPRLFEAVISGAVGLAGSLVTGPTASGRVAVEEAEIRIPNSPLSRWGHVPEGLRHVGEDAESRRTRTNAGLATPQVAADTRPRRRLPLFLDLELSAPGRIFVRGRGLDAELGGTLRLSGTTTDTIPAGAFSLIRGRLDLLGNRFTLTDGSASFIGNFVPVVRLVASTESRGVVTSIVLAGPVDGPEIRFESVPELPQDEVLARLLFGRSLATLSPFQAAQLGMSVATLTGQAEVGVIDRTRRALGLDDLDFTTDERGSAALRAGRYLGERVYTDLSVTSEGRSEVRLQLDLTPALTLRGRADSEGRSAVGIFFERDY